MDLDLIEKLMRMLEQSDLEMLDVTEGDMRVRLAKAGAKPEAAPDAETAAVAMEAPAVLTSGLSGTFFRAPSPDAPPFVAVGDRIAEGQVVGLVEAMKTFNPIESDRAGRVAEILAADGEAIARGAPVLRFDTGE